MYIIVDSPEKLMAEFAILLEKEITLEKSDRVPGRVVVLGIRDGNSMDIHKLRHAGFTVRETVNEF
ncbi:MAG: hypothetical protein US18_C0002G0009 [Parcubacteria group bacterium GW2011_GWB1_36_5]|nr:MAG: hypothetical protein US12_C0001G0009 [Parcubacteria group bacterium GW2011_GWA2_36_24]KKQ08120.1 MAG: hypothetical protein US18_C0002G0009 [Parcubacteria group bacterium GW2011_GWB1_36_5]